MTASEGPTPAAPGPADRDQVSPLEAALDMLVYAPLGFALSASEELPKLAAIGRSEMEQRVNTARVVGRFAVEAGRRELERRLGDLFGTAEDEAPAKPEPRPGGAADAGAAGAGATEAAGGTRAPEPGPSGGAGGTTKGPTKDVPAGPAPDVSSLAIPGYDSLSASQVIQRLAGLESEELEAVRLYEEANRGRRTIMSRIRQLQGG